MNKEQFPQWNLKRAKEFYNISIWSEGYYDINEVGHIIACPDSMTKIDLMDVKDELIKQGISLPVLIRFPQILNARLKELSDAFENAALNCNYAIDHIPFYPIKVNQQKTVLEHILTSDVSSIGLEVGSKTELLAALSLLNYSDGLLVCNGYKDRAYVRLALYAHMMGIQVYIVIENLSEIDLIQKECSDLEIEPLLGVRVRLSSMASGNWQNSGGKHAKFGLDANDLVKLLKRLNASNCVHWLSVLHFHMGSQISDLTDIKLGLSEAMRVYHELYAQDFSISCIDVGGGLAVDYSSLQDTSYFSKAYSLKDYAQIIIKTVGDYCENNKLPLPKIFTENGRAITAHHAVLITNVIEQDGADEHEAVSDKSVECSITQTLKEQIKSNKTINEKELASYHKQINQQFIVGEIGLNQRAHLEELLQKCASDLKVTAKYYANFSLFQSMPDTWGLDQIFPIVPLNRLNEEPQVPARIHDLTCDSDGQVSLYAYDHQLKPNLQLHVLREGEQYLLGFFMLGAYQEILGDIHNLFGDTHAVNVEKLDQDELLFTNFEIGDCVNELLTRVHISESDVLAKCKAKLNEMKTENEVQDTVLNEIKNALFGYTYLDSMNRPAHRIKD